MKKIINNKKALVQSKLIAIILVLVSFFVIALVVKHALKKADDSAQEAMCRASVAFIDKINREGGMKGKIASSNIPFLCFTNNKIIKPYSDEDLKKQISDLMERCWWMFGEGLIRKPFKTGSVIRNDCFVCYTLSIRETRNFKEGIESTELLNYMYETPYKVKRTDKEFDCYNKIDDDGNGQCDLKGCNGMKPDENCIKIKDAYECEKKGGVCKEECGKDEKIFNEWQCKRGEKCCVNEENTLSYLSNIYNNGGVVLILTKDIKPGETYAISFGAPSKESSTERLGWKFVVGGAAVAVGGAVIAMSGGTLTPLGAYVIKAGAAAIASGIIYAGGAKTVKEIFYDPRKQPSIYLTRLDDVKEECGFVYS